MVFETSGFANAKNLMFLANSVQSAAGAVSPAAEAGALWDLSGKPCSYVLAHCLCNKRVSWRFTLSGPKANCFWATHA
jgi:hypothetical protein